MAMDYSALIEEISNPTLESLIDDDAVLKIDVQKRTISIPTNFNKQIAISNDQNSEVITFECPKVIEGYKIFEKILDTKIFCFVKWKNASEEEGYYEVAHNSFQSLEDNDEAFSFEWIIDKRVAAAEGKIEFSIQFLEYTQIDGGDVKTLYSWQTAICPELSVGEGIYVEEIDDKNIIDEDFSFDNIENLRHSGLVDENSPLTLNVKNRDFSVSEDFPNILCRNDASSMAISFAIDGTPDFDLENAYYFVKWRVNDQTGYDKLAYVWATNSIVWAVSPEVTRDFGKLEFQFLIICPLGEEENSINIRWHSKICSILTIEDSIDCEDIDKEPFIPETGNYFVEIVEEDGEKWLSIRQNLS